MQPRGARRLSRKTNASLPRYLFFRRTCYVTHRSFSTRSFSPAFVLHCELVAKPAKEQRGYTEASTKQKEQRELRTFARVGCRSRTSICDGRCLTSPRGLAPSAQVNRAPKQRRNTRGGPFRRGNMRKPKEALVRPFSYFFCSIFSGIEKVRANCVRPGVNPAGVASTASSASRRQMNDVSSLKRYDLRDLPFVTMPSH